MSVTADIHSCVTTKPNSSLASDSQATKSQTSNKTRTEKDRYNSCGCDKSLSAVTLNDDSMVGKVLVVISQKKRG